MQGGFLHKKPFIDRRGVVGYFVKRLCLCSHQAVERLERNGYVLAVLSTADGRALSPVQLQKLFFLLDARVADRLGGRYFNFAPYDYGPFDADVYRVVEALESDGRAAISASSPSWRSYRLTPEGQLEGAALLATLDPKVRDYARRCCEFVLGLSFTELVSAIYREFPEMKANSVFVDQS
ncbi:MAG: hypothetical protein ACRERC_06495 [Candidatus Binatia bacterium]